MRELLLFQYQIPFQCIELVSTFGGAFGIDAVIPDALGFQLLASLTYAAAFM